VDADRTLDLLEGNEGARKAWQKLLVQNRNGLPRADPILILSMILECKKLAPFNKNMASLQKAANEDDEHLLQAVELLEKHFSSLRPMVSTHPKVKYFNDGISSVVAALPWMREQIRTRTEFLNRINNEMFPRSRKRNNERLAFQLMLSKQIANAFNGVPDTFIKSIADTLYPTSQDDFESFGRAKRRAKLKT